MVRWDTSFFLLLMLVLSRSEDAEGNHSERRSWSESSQRNTSGNPALRELLEGLISSTMRSPSPENQDLGPQIPEHSQVDGENLHPEFVEEDSSSFDVSLDETLFELLNLLGNESRKKRKVNTSRTRNPQRVRDSQLFSQFGRPSQPIHSRTINSLSRNAQTQKLEDNSESVFSLDNGSAMMKMIKGMPREFKLRFIALLLRSDRRGLQDFLREVIAFHMRSQKDDGALRSNAVGGKLSPDMESLRGTGKSLQLPRLTNGLRNKADRQLILSPVRFASRQGSPAAISVLEAENLMLPNIQSAVILHRETISEPGKILKVIRRPKGKSVQQLPSFHPNAQLKASRTKPVAVPEPAKLHHFIRQSSASGRPSSSVNSFKTTADLSAHRKNNERKPNDTISISSSDLSRMLDRIRNTPAFNKIVNNIMELLKSDDGLTKLSSMPAFSNAGKSLLGPSPPRSEAATSRPAKKVSSNTRKVAKNSVGVPLPLPGNLDTRINFDVARQTPQHSNNSQQPQNASTQRAKLRLQHSEGQFSSELSTIENQLRGGINEQNFLHKSSEKSRPFQQNRFFSTPPDFSHEIIGFSRTAFNPSPVLTVEPQTIVPLSTDIEGQLFDEAIENFKDKTEGSSITTGNFVDGNTDFNSGVLNFVPLSTDIKGQLTDVPEITANDPSEITGQVLTSSGVPLPIGQSISSANAAGPEGFALALGDFSQTGQSSSVTNNQIPNNSGSSNAVGIPLPSVNSAQQQTLTNPVTFADILRTQSEDSFDVTLQKATANVPPRQTVGVPLPQNPRIDANVPLSSSDNSLPGKSLAISNSDQGSFNLNSLPATDIFGNPIGVPLPGLQDTSSSSSFPSEQADVGRDVGEVGIPLPTGAQNFNSGGPNVLSFPPQTDIFGNIINLPLDELHNSGFNEQQSITDSFDTQSAGNVGVPLPPLSSDGRANNDFNTAPQTDIFGNIINIPLSDLQNVRFLSSSEEILPGNVGFALPPFSRNFTSPSTGFNLNNQGGPIANFVGVPLPSFQDESGFQNLPKSQNSGDVGVPLPEVSSGLNDFVEPSDERDSHDQFSFLSTLTNSKESIEADDIFISSGLSSQSQSNLGGYDVIDEKGYPSHSQKHKLVTFFSSGLLLPFTEREVMYKKKESPQHLRPPPQPPKYHHHFKVYKEGENDDVGSDNAYHRVPSLTYTVPPLLDSTYAARSLSCQSQTVVTTSVLLVDVPASVTTITELTTAVQLVKSYYVTPVTVAQTYTAHTLNTAAQYQAGYDKDNRQRDFPPPTTVQRLPAISLLAPSSLFNAVDRDTGIKKTYALPNVRRKRSSHFDSDTPSVQKLAAYEVPGNGSQRIPFILDHTVRIGQPLSSADSRSQFQQPAHNVNSAPQNPAVPARQDFIVAAHQQYSPLEQDYGLPLQNEYSLPIQNEYVAPVQNEYVPPVQNEYVAPVQNEYVAPVQNEYVPPVQNEYALPVQNEYALPVQNEYAPPVQNEYVPPVQNEYAPPVQNEYAPPVQNEYVAPVQNEYVPPVQNEYVPPVQNEYAPPVQNEYAPPVQNEYVAPVQNEYVAPVQNEYVAPVQNEYVAPVQNEYVAPVQNEYAPPVQNEYSPPVLDNFNVPQQNYGLPVQKEYIPPVRSLYAPSSTVIVTTVLRTMTSMVPRTLVGTNYKVSTVSLGQTATTIRSTSVYCLQPDQRKGQYNQYSPPVQLHSATPPLPISPHNTQHGGVPTVFVRPTPKLKPDGSSYQTWVGAVVGKDNAYSTPHSSDLPSKFILLQNLKPRGFVVEDGSKNGGMRVKLSHDDGKYGGLLNRKLSLDSVADSDSGAALPDTKLAYQSPQRQ